jgi:hypothetical protein
VTGALPYVPDRDHPGYLRRCIRPDCTATYNVLDVMEGRARADGWRMITRVLSGQVCPAHAGPLIDGSHLPRWGRDPDDDVVKSIICPCGWAWSPHPCAAVTVQHEYQDRWVEHLISLDTITAKDG